MKLFRSAINLMFSNNLFTQSLSKNRRFFCSTTTGRSVTTSENNSNSSKSTDISETNDTKTIQSRPDRARYDEFIEKDIETGIKITSYSICGFRLNNYVQVIGPIILFPRAVFSWNIESVDKVTDDSLMIFGLIQPKVDTLVVGIGDLDTSANIGKILLTFAHKHKINIEILSTELACTQFNFLTDEGRMVAAALIPPTAISHGEDDVFQSHNLDSNLFTLDNWHTPDVVDLRKEYKFLRTSKK